PYVEQDDEAIVMPASGCGVLGKECRHLRRGGAAYAAKAAKISGRTEDAAETLNTESAALEEARVGCQTERPAEESLRVAFHSPCTLQHGQQITGVVERLLTAAGYKLTYVPDAHLCCGSAGTYSLLQPELSQRLLANKVGALESGGPQ